MTLSKAIERVIDACTAEGALYSCEIYRIMYRYKAIRDLDEKQQDEIYELVSLFSRDG